MHTTDLFQAALGLVPPWTVSRVEFSPTDAGASSQLDLHLDLDIPRPVNSLTVRECSASATPVATTGARLVVPASALHPVPGIRPAGASLGTFGTATPSSGR